MKLPWDKPKPQAATPSFPVLHAVQVDPVMFHGQAIKWKINLHFDRKVVCVGTLTDEERARNIAAEIADGLI